MEVTPVVPVWPPMVRRLLLLELWGEQKKTTWHPQRVKVVETPSLRESHALQPGAMVPRSVALPYTVRLLRWLPLLRPAEGHPLRTGGRLVLLRSLLLLLPALTRASATLADLLQQKDVAHQSLCRVLSVALLSTSLSPPFPVRVKLRLHLQAAALMVSLLRWLLLPRLAVEELPRAEAGERPPPTTPSVPSNLEKSFYTLIHSRALIRAQHYVFRGHQTTNSVHGTRIITR